MENEKKQDCKINIPNSQYKLTFEDNKDDIYNLQISIKSEFIIFKLINYNVISFNYYLKKYELTEIVNILCLPLSLYNSLEKVKKFIDEVITRKLYKLEKEKEKQNIFLIFKFPIGFEEIESKIEIDKINLDIDNSLNEEIISLKKKLNLNEKITSELKEKIEQMEKKINDIENLNKLLLSEKMKDFGIFSEKRNKEKDEKLNHKFIKNPQNLKFKLNINTTNDSFGRNDIFEVFFSVKDLKGYLISKNNNYNLDIYRLEDNTLIKSIKHHTNHITIVRYFLDSNSNKEYLITADENKLVTLWDIQDEFKIIYDIKPGYSGKIYSSLLVFGINEKNYLLTCSTGSNEYTKKFNFESGKFIENINKTNNNYTYYLLYWLNKKNNEHYIIECCDGKVSIYNLIKDEIYAELKAPKDYRNFSGFIYTKNEIDYLCKGCGNGYIHIWDLFSKTLNCSLYDNSGNYLHHIIQWNDKYAIIADVSGCSFKIFDIEEKKYICNIGGQHSKYVIGVKKINHPIYGESLLSAGNDSNIKLWNNILVE